MRRPFDYFVSALVFVPEPDGWWVAHLHSFQPGAVIGRRGELADRIRQSLVDVKGDDRLRLNIAAHEVFGCPARPDPAPG